MESYLNKQVPSAGEKKIDEYVARIARGEKKEDIFKGLPQVFRSNIEQKLASLSVKSAEVTHQPEQELTMNFSRSGLGFEGRIIIDGENIGHFSIWTIDSDKAYIHDIQIGYGEKAPRNKGYGFKVYKKIIEELGKNNIKLVSTNFSISGTSISPQALRVWQKLEELGYARKTGQVFGKIHDRFTGDERVENIPTYESVLL